MSCVLPHQEVPSGRSLGRALTVCFGCAIWLADPQATQDQIVDGARKVVASLAPGAKWLNSWTSVEAKKLLCEWEAPDADAVRASLEPTKDLLPVEALYEVERIDPQWYK